MTEIFKSIVLKAILSFHTSIQISEKFTPGPPIDN